MSRGAFYNENDPFAADWLENLISAGLIPAGTVDRRDIREVRARNLEGYSQCHFFAGIGGWPRALHLAGWPEDKPVWTGSCPCPPFSQAGKKGKCPRCQSRHLVPCPRRTGYFICANCAYAWLADTRHLWPELWRLIRDCRPAVCYGEQVASSDGRLWLAGVRGSLEILGYDVGCSDLCSAGAGGDHIRQRLFWVADADERQRGRLADGQGRERNRQEAGRFESNSVIEPCGEAERLGNSEISRDGAQRREPRQGTQSQEQVGGHGLSSRLADAARDGRGEEYTHSGRRCEGSRAQGLDERPEHERVCCGGVGNSDYSGSQGWGILSERAGKCASRAAMLVPCADGKFRRVEPGAFPLAHALPRSLGSGSAPSQRMELMAAKTNRIGRLRGYGNAIDPVLAAEFILAGEGVRG